ncbi:hypothetical protein OKW40_004389 [Paraburkholderia sp. RAU6.4a]|uniref:hypothetical protein n=1 Tax=Paraburkholderia sp. RAU6.4a TaxID=2991067 RepID=UPI003D2132EB
MNLNGRNSDYKHIRSGRDKVRGAQHLISGAGEIADYGRSYCPPEIATLHRCPKRKALLLSAVKNGGLPKALDLPLYLAINVGGINIDARRHRWSLRYRTGVF